MKLILTTLNGDIFPLEVPPDLKLSDFKQLCSSECGIRYEELSVSLDGRQLESNDSVLSSFNVREGDLILVQRKSSEPSGSGLTNRLDFSNIQIPGASPSNSRGNSRPNLDNPDAVREMYLSNPEAMAYLREADPMLAEAITKGGRDFTRLFQERKKLKEEEKRKLEVLRTDPMSAEAQRLIQEEINRQNIASNMETALEFHPESFGSVHMLYINCKVNNHPVKAFIDSGAQSTIMSSSCAERCGITRLIDTRWSGIAKGVGTQKIKGRVHLCQVQIENDFFPTSFIILEGQDMEMLLGLDMLKRHQCCIDLKNNVLIIGTTGATTKFLSEREIPKFDKFS